MLRGSGFCQIGFGGTKGFMSSAYLSESGGGAPVTSGYLIVNSPNGGKVNLRAQPASTAKVLTKCQNGTRLEVIEGGLNWCKVYSKTTSMTGYIMTRFTTVYGLPGTPTKTVSNGKNYVNLRSTKCRCPACIEVVQCLHERRRYADNLNCDIDSRR